MLRRLIAKGGTAAAARDSGASLAGDPVGLHPVAGARHPPSCDGTGPGSGNAAADRPAFLRHAGRSCMISPAMRLQHSAPAGAILPSSPPRPTGPRVSRRTSLAPPKVIGTLAGHRQAVVSRSFWSSAMRRPQESGDDETLVRQSGPCAEACLPHSGRRRQEPSRWLSLPGFLHREDPPLRDILARVPGAVIAGRYPRPIKVSS